MARRPQRRMVTLRTGLSPQFRGATGLRGFGTKERSINVFSVQPQAATVSPESQAATSPVSVNALTSTGSNLAPKTGPQPLSMDPVEREAFFSGFIGGYPTSPAAMQVPAAVTAIRAGLPVTNALARVLFAPPALAIAGYRGLRNALAVGRSVKDDPGEQYGLAVGKGLGSRHEAQYGPAPVHMQDPAPTGLPIGTGLGGYHATADLMSAPFGTSGGLAIGTSLGSQHEASSGGLGGIGAGGLGGGTGGEGDSGTTGAGLGLGHGGDADAEGFW